MLLDREEKCFEREKQTLIHVWRIGKCGSNWYSGYITLSHSTIFFNTNKTKNSSIPSAPKALGSLDQLCLLQFDYIHFIGIILSLLYFRPYFILSSTCNTNTVLVSFCCMLYVMVTSLHRGPQTGWSCHKFVDCSGFTTLCRWQT